MSTGRKVTSQAQGRLAVVMEESLNGQSLMLLRYVLTPSLPISAMVQDFRDLAMSIPT